MRTWFITGASRGLGRAFADAALDRGDRVVAASRTIATDDFDEKHADRLLALTLDVTDRAAVIAAVATAVEHFGRLDIVVNNAGTLSMGMIEEFTEAEARAQFEVNLFGALWVSQAVLPHLRAQRAGHIVQVSSIAALGGFPSTGLYSASKFALEGMSEALAMEAAAFDIKVSIVQPGGYWTDLYTSLSATAPLAAVRAAARRNGAAVGGRLHRQRTPARRRGAAAPGRQRRPAATAPARQHGLRPGVRHLPPTDGHLGELGAGQPSGRARRRGPRASAVTVLVSPRAGGAAS